MARKASIYARDALACVKVILSPPAPSVLPARTTPRLAGHGDRPRPPVSTGAAFNARRPLIDVAVVDDTESPAFSEVWRASKSSSSADIASSRPHSVAPATTKGAGPRTILSAAPRPLCHTEKQYVAEQSVAARATVRRSARVHHLLLAPARAPLVALSLGMVVEAHQYEERRGNGWLGDAGIDFSGKVVQLMHK